MQINYYLGRRIAPKPPRPRYPRDPLNPPLAPRGGRLVELIPGLLVLLGITLICLPLKSESSKAIAVSVESLSANST